MPIIKGPLKLKGTESLAKTVREMTSDNNQKLNLPFKATGWKSEKMPAGIDKKDIENGEISVKPVKEAKK